MKTVLEAFVFFFVNLGVMAVTRLWSLKALPRSFGAVVNFAWSLVSFRIR